MNPKKNYNKIHQYYFIIIFFIITSIVLLFSWQLFNKSVNERFKDFIISDKNSQTKEKISLPNPFFLAQTPISNTFSSPMGSPSGAFTYIAQDFLEYNKLRQSFHAGIDLNGIGGDNTDLGDIVYSIGDGIVLEAKDFGNGWGKIVIILHRLKNGKFFQSLYAHLNKISVTIGQIVSRNDKIGNVGNVNGLYLAHLHFEIIEGIYPHIGQGYLTNILEKKHPFSAKRMSLNNNINSLETFLKKNNAHLINKNDSFIGLDLNVIIKKNNLNRKIIKMINQKSQTTKTIKIKLPLLPLGSDGIRKFLLLSV